MAGRFEIDYLGATEVYPLREQLEFCAAGAVDMVSTFSIPGLSVISTARDIAFGAKAPEFRSGGLLAVMDEIARESMGVSLLGWTMSFQYNIFLAVDDPVTSFYDLGEYTVRTIPYYTPILKHLGVGLVDIPFPELAPALETGVVDGMAWPSSTLVVYGVHEKIKYELYPPLWERQSIAALANAARFDALPADIKGELIDLMKVVEGENYNIWLKNVEEETSVLREHGIKPLWIADEDEWWAAQEAHWEGSLATLEEVASPENFEKLKGVLIDGGYYPPKAVFSVEYDWE